MVPINAFIALVNLMHKRKIAVWPDVQCKDDEPTKKTDTEGLQTDHPEKLIEYLEDRGKG